ncbi:MAG: AmmeMemoRadiSam system radical SAM enzyme [Candidatus Omnitrophota bacterium]|nr:MAG: AmmeMemoRadiSam system radical SAM enzyme [Candidatus Omnitrophota bacterium]
MGIKAPLREAMFYEKLKGKDVQCQICFRKCIIKDGQRGFCRNRENRGGKLYNIVYAKVSALQIDPIEKEPTFHMLPGSDILCFGTAGCNFRCKFCHNWHLSQRSLEQMSSIYEIKPEAAVDYALKKNILALSFTFNDPIAFYEFVYDTAKIAKQKGLKILWHSNCSMEPESLRALLKYTDAVALDLKGFTQKFYQDISEAKLEPVLRAAKIIKEEGVWLEIVNLVVPTLNDNPADMRRMCSWIKDNLGENTPIHFSRFFPNYRLTSLPPTPIPTLERAYQIAKESGLRFVSIGNAPGHKYNSTFCPRCGERIIHRVHFQVLGNNIVDGKCKFCKEPIPGIWT